MPSKKPPERAEGIGMENCYEGRIRQSSEGDFLGANLREEIFTN
jgi:hypothetical protein